MAVVVVIFALSFILAACGADPGQPLFDIHQEGQLDDKPSINRDLCLSCHYDEDIIESTRNYGRESNLNIHKPPKSMMSYSGDCTSCHLTDKRPVLSCNNCHDYRIPKGWVAP